MNAPRVGALCAILVLLPAAPGEAGDVPSRCIARWQGPVPGCGLRDPVSTEGLGSSERGAERQARHNLAMAVAAARVAKAASLPPGARELMIAESAGCARTAPDTAKVTCFPEPLLRTVRYCSLELTGGDCAVSEGFTLDGRAWKAGERAREDICGIPEEDPLQVEAAEAVCRAACWGQARLKCGSAG
ncbi:MAG: hypothetical protein ABIO70_11275 [Pseudomonadota bacterium]